MVTCEGLRENFKELSRNKYFLISIWQDYVSMVKRIANARFDLNAKVECCFLLLFCKSHVSLMYVLFQ